MEATPQQKGITIEFDCQFRVCVVQSSFSSIMKAFLMLLPQLLEDFFQKVLVGFGEYEMTQERKLFACQSCGNDREFIWKTRHGKATQGGCKTCGSKQYITRTLLGMDPRKRIPEETRRKLALMGALTSYRVLEKFGKMFGWAIDKMTIWRSVQRVGAGIDFVLDENEAPRCEADGTGVGITGIAKRGKELKVLVQYKKGGGIRVAGIDISNYNGSWDKLFQKSIEVIKKFKEPFLLLTDGDTSIFESLKGKVTIRVQRCLWHIPYQAQYALWSGGVKRKSREWLHVVAELMEICAIRPLVDCPDTIKAMIESKKARLKKVIDYCQEKEFKALCILS